MNTLNAKNIKDIEITSSKDMVPMTEFTGYKPEDFVKSTTAVTSPIESQQMQAGNYVIQLSGYKTRPLLSLVVMQE